MAYRKTEKVLANAAAKSDAIIAAAADVIAKLGEDECSSELIATRADVSVGLVFHYFPNITELKAAMVQKHLGRDVEAMRKAAGATHYPLNAIADAIAVFYGRLKEPRLVRVLLAAPAYNEGIRDELVTLLKRADLGLTPKARQVTAAAMLGAIAGAYDASAGSRTGASMVAAFILRGLGVPMAAAARLVEA